jgi:hypothetical protein
MPMSRIERSTDEMAAAMLLPGDASRRTRAFRVTALQLGIVAGLLAVIAGAFFEVRPPEAYGVCMACHARDLVTWTTNRLAGTHLTVAPASLVFPVLTVLGVLLGALLGSTTSGEFRWSAPDNSFKTFLYGAVVMISALIAGGCSIRLLLRSAAGELLGLMGFGGMVAGVVLGTFWLRWRASR